MAAPRSTPRQLANLWFAGDFCRNKVGLTTIESAATAGVEVAAGIVARHGIGSAGHGARAAVAAGRDVRLATHGVGAVRRPGAKTWSSGSDGLANVGGRLRAALR